MAGGIRDRVAAALRRAAGEIDNRGSRLAGPISRRSYKGGAQNDYTRHWNPSAAGPNTIIGAKAATLRSRSRDLLRNNAHAAGAVQKLTTRVIGCGIRPRTKTDDDALNSFVDALWEEWAEQASISDDLSIYGLQELAFRAMLESGEVLLRRRRRRPNDASIGKKLVVPLQVQLLEADHLDPWKTGVFQSGGGRYVQGVEFDVIDRRIAYWLLPTHPGEQLIAAPQSFVSERVDADAIAHLFQVLRPGQARGVPWLAPVMRTLHDLDEYGDTELVRQKLSSCLMAFVTTDDIGTGAVLGAPETGDTQSAPVVEDVNGYPLDRLEPGMIGVLRGQKSVSMTQPQALPGYGEYVASQLQRIASGIGITFEQLSADLSRVNYSSYRAGHLEHRALVEALQENLAIPIICRPVRRWWIEQAIAAELIPERDYPTEWSPPRYEDVDRVKEATADLIEMRSGTVARSEIIARKGYDPAEVVAQIKADADKADELELVFDSDPRQTSGAGMAQSAAAANGANGQPAPDASARAIAAAALRAVREGDVETADALSGALKALALQAGREESQTTQD